MDINKMGRRPSNHDNATRQLRLKQREAALVCPKCGAMNRPGASLIELDETDTAWCGVCADCWVIQAEPLS